MLRRTNRRSRAARATHLPRCCRAPAEATTRLIAGEDAHRQKAGHFEGPRRKPQPLHAHGLSRPQGSRSPSVFQRDGRRETARHPHHAAGSMPAAPARAGAVHRNRERMYRSGPLPDPHEPERPRQRSGTSGSTTGPKSRRPATPDSSHDADHHDQRSRFRGVDSTSPDDGERHIAWRADGPRDLPKSPPGRENDRADAGHVEEGDEPERHPGEAGGGARSHGGIVARPRPENVTGLCRPPPPFCRRFRRSLRPRPHRP